MVAESAVEHGTTHFDDGMSLWRYDYLGMDCWRGVGRLACGLEGISSRWIKMKLKYGYIIAICSGICHRNVIPRATVSYAFFNFVVVYQYGPAGSVGCVWIYVAFQ